MPTMQTSDDAGRRFNRTLALGALVALVAAPGAAAQDTLPTVDRILARYVEAAGGQEAIARLHTRVTRGSFVEDVPSEGPATATRFEARSRVPGMLLLEWCFPGRIDRTGSDGSVGWETRGDTVRCSDGIVRSKEAFVFDPQAPLRIGEYFGDLAVSGTVRVGGRDAYEVTTDRRDAHFALYFDVETGLLVRIGFYWDLGDYREVDGVMIPFRITQSRKGGSSAYVVHGVEHNVPLDMSEFAMPGEGSF